MAQYASMYGMEFSVKNNFLPELLKEFKKVAIETQKEAVNEVAREVREKAAKDTGAMAASVYVVYKSGSDYNFRVATAKDLRPEWEVYNEKLSVESDAEVGLGVAIGYAGFVEFGHHSKDGGWVPAQPFFWPVVQGMRDRFIEAMSKVPEKAIRAAGG